ncbi:hypothetical protein [Anabaena sp. PCC 7108]|uniref:hypothetical protein n=1 Tax=Anabaena sp. PCC 7108 TaxID=163908 RepID=UPI0003476EF6|nr:hypothetical protein [Anabaena sp. PCC 7108]
MIVGGLMMNVLLIQFYRQLGDDREQTYRKQLTESGNNFSLYPLLISNDYF